MNHRAGEHMNHTAERTECLDENSPCRLFFVPATKLDKYRDTIIRIAISAAIVFGGSMAGVIWKASAYAAKVDGLALTVKTQGDNISLLVNAINNNTQVVNENNNIMRSRGWGPTP